MAMYGALTISRSQVRRLGRYGVVSLASTAVGEGLLAIFVGYLRWPAAAANLAAACIALGPIYILSRRWVWRVDQSPSIVREALPFWIISLAGVVLSTIAAGGADAWAHGLRLSHAGDTAIVVAVVLLSYGVLWLLRFFVLDRLVFRR